MFGFLKGRLQTYKKNRIIIRKKPKVHGGSLKRHEIVLLMQRVHNPCDAFKILMKFSNSIFLAFFIHVKGITSMI